MIQEGDVNRNMMQNDYQNNYSSNNNDYSSQNQSDSNNQFQSYEDESALKQLVSKKKEQHRVEIRKKQNEQKFKLNRIQITYLQDIKKCKDFNEKDQIDVKSLNINQCIDSFVNAYRANNLDLIKYQVLCIRYCVTLEDKLKELEYSNKAIFEKGLLQFLVTYLSIQYDEEYDLQRDALWIISHFLSEQNLRHILYVLENIPLTVFFRLLETGKNSIKEYALLSIYNIIDENPIGVKVLIENGIIQLVRNIVLTLLPTNPNLLSSTILIIKTLISYSNESGSEQIQFEQLMPMIEVILPIFSYVEQDEEATDDLFETIQKITERDDDDIDQFYSTYNGIIIKTLHYIKNNIKQSGKFLTPPLRIIQNLTNTYDHITESLVQFGLLDMISQLLKHRSYQLKRLILFTLSNVCGSGSSIIDYMMQHKVIILDILNAMENPDFLLKKEATICFCNILLTINRRQIEEFLFDYDGINLLVNQIKYVDIDLNIKIVKALYNIVKIGETIKNKKNYFYNIYAKKFNQYGGREKVTGLSESENKKLKTVSEKLLALSYIVDETENDMEQQYQEDNQDLNNDSFQEDDGSDEEGHSNQDEN